MVLYTSGCNFRCPFCHNQELVLKQGIATTSLNAIIPLIEVRRHFVEGVVVTGGEPTIQDDLLDLILEIKERGLSVKLDTNGYNPDVLNVLLRRKCLDYIAMDIKTSWGKYPLAAGRDVDIHHLEQSLDLLQKSAPEYEIRTTCVPGLVDGTDISAISRLVDNRGQFTLQQFQTKDTLNPVFSRIAPYSLETLQYFREIASRNTENCRLIGI